MSSKSFRYIVIKPSGMIVYPESGKTLSKKDAQRGAPLALKEPEVVHAIVTEDVLSVNQEATLA